jgi:hypothetical protein
MAKLVPEWLADKDTRRNVAMQKFRQIGIAGVALVAFDIRWMTSPSEPFSARTAEISEQQTNLMGLALGMLAVPITAGFVTGARKWGRKVARESFTLPPPVAKPAPTIETCDMSDDERDKLMGDFTQIVNHTDIYLEFPDAE